MTRHWPRHFVVVSLAVAGVLLLIAGFVKPTETNAITVTNPSMGTLNQASVTADDLKPAGCGSQVLDVLVAGNGTATVTGSAANSLLLSDGATLTINGGSGNECLVGGSLVSTLNGGTGTDVCIGPASATFNNCDTTIHEP